eukprot:gene8601-10950_t
MHGNVYEWVEDCENDSYVGAPSDGSAWLTGQCEVRQIRGNDWGEAPVFSRSGNRNSLNSNPTHLGTRLNRAPPDSSSYYRPANGKPPRAGLHLPTARSFMTAAPRSAIRELLSLLKPYRRIVISSITLGIIGGLSVTALLATVNRGLHSADGMGTGVVLAFAGLCLLALLSSIGADIGTNFVGQKVIAKLRKDLGAKVLAAPIEQIERYRTHRLIP